MSTPSQLPPPQNVTPVYSHGGSTFGPFIAVPGTTVSSGRPVSIYQWPQQSWSEFLWPAMFIFFTGTSATVLLEGSSGLISGSPPAPPSGEWVQIQSYSMATGDKQVPLCPPQFLYFRTRITAIVAGTVTSYIGNAAWFQITYPQILS